MGNTVAQIAFRLNGKHLGRFAVAAVFLFFSAVFADDCESGDYTVCNPFGQYTCREPQWSNEPVCTSTYCYSGCNYDNGFVNCTFQCTSQCAADSLICVNAGKEWIPGTGGECGTCNDCDEQCQCEERPGMIWNGTECVEDSSLCAEDRATCVRAGGIFAGSTNSGCCVSTCDLCGNATMLRWKNLKTAECCNQGMAPPDSIRDCRTMSSNECGMSVSTLTTMTTTDYECQDPNLDAQVKQRFFDQCFEPSSSNSSPGSSTSGGSSSSMGSSDSQGNSSVNDSPYPEGCDECPYLDSILDTLIKQKQNTDDIIACLVTPGLCAGLEINIPDSIKTPVFAFDTAFRKYLQPLMDSSLKLDSNQIKALMKLDTNMLKQLRTDSVKLQNDTNTWRVVEGAGDQVDTSIHSMNDTTRKWFKRIADSIGVSTDSLAAHIDSIVRHIPDSILDSIVKYQQYATDNFDSVLFGHGKGFSLVDSLIDSSVKYFKESNQKWNEYVSMYGDSTQKIHEEIIDLPGRNASAVGSALGYGDTASTNLRGDLNGIREAIEGLGDTSGLGAAMGGAGGSGTGSDTSGYDSYVNTMSGRYANLARNASGGAWGDSASLETVFAATSADSIDPDSASENEHRSWMDSATARLSRSRDSLMRDTTLLANYYDTLKKEMQFFNFDSVILAPLREALPATNSCPEDCFKGEVDIGVTHTISTIEVNYGLCRKWFGDADIFMIFRVLLRLVTALTCVYIGAWYIANRKV